MCGLHLQRFPAIARQCFKIFLRSIPLSKDNLGSVPAWSFDLDIELKFQSTCKYTVDSELGT